MFYKDNRVSWKFTFCKKFDILSKITDKQMFEQNWKEVFWYEIKWKNSDSSSSVNIKQPKMSLPFDNQDNLYMKSFSKRPIFIRQVSSDVLSVISYKTAQQSSKLFRELSVSSLIKGSNGSLQKPYRFPVRIFKKHFRKILWKCSQISGFIIFECLKNSKILAFTLHLRQ